MNHQIIVCVGLSAALSFATPAASQDQPEALPSETRALIQEALDAAEMKLFHPGPAVADWSKGGIDLKAAVGQKPGGLERNYLLAIDKDGEASVSIYSSAPVASVIPPSWKRVARVGDADGGGPDSFLDFASLDASYYLVARGTNKRVGDAYCSSTPVGADLYYVPGNQSAKAMPVEVAKLIFEAAVAMTAKYTVCEKYEASATGFGVRYFLDDGRSLPGMDEGKDQISIVPAQPLTELLKPKA